MFVCPSTDGGPGRGALGLVGAGVGGLGSGSGRWTRGGICGAAGCCARALVATSANAALHSRSE